MFREKSEAGGWTTVLQKRYQRVTAGERGRYGKMIMLFVEDMPDSMDQHAMFKLFSKFGVVRDVYLPNKRKRLGKQFGFVHFDCEVIVEVAIQKTNGMWMNDKVLKVKGRVADYQRHQGPKTFERGNTRISPLSGAGVAPARATNHGQSSMIQNQTFSGRDSFANVVKRGKVQNSSLLMVKGASIGNGWLHRSVVASLCDYRSSEFLIESFMQNRVGNATAKRLGNKQVLLTFQTEELMKLCIEQHNKGGSQWFSLIYPWTVDSVGAFDLGGGVSSTSDDGTEIEFERGSVRIPSGTMRKARMSTFSSDGAMFEMEDGSSEEGGLQELERSAMGNGSSQDEEDEEVVIHIEGNDARINGHLSGIEKNKSTAENPKSPEQSVPLNGDFSVDPEMGEGVGSRALIIWEPTQKEAGFIADKNGGQIRVGVVDPARSNFCGPVEEFIGPDQSVEGIHLEVVLELGPDLNIPNGDLWNGGTQAQADDKRQGCGGEQVNADSNFIDKCMSLVLSVTAMQQTSEGAKSSVLSPGRMSSYHVKEWRKDGYRSSVAAQTKDHPEIQSIQDTECPRILQRQRSGAVNDESDMTRHAGGGNLRKRGRPPKKKVVVSAVAKALGKASSGFEERCSYVLESANEEAERVWRIGRAIGLFSSETDASVVSRIADLASGGGRGQKASR
ncbi:hypothetical protein Dimus_021208 [Dionaea muscipula]